MNASGNHRFLKQRSGLVTASVLAAGAAVTVLLTDRGIWPKCPIYAITGFYCPGCGLLRATEALLQGNLPQAVDQNALLPFLPVLLALGILAQRIDRKWLTVTVIALAAVLAVSFTVLRNLPGSWLAPS